MYFVHNECICGNNDIMLERVGIYNESCGCPLPLCRSFLIPVDVSGDDDILWLLLTRKPPCGGIARWHQADL